MSIGVFDLDEALLGHRRGAARELNRGPQGRFALGIWGRRRSSYRYRRRRGLVDVVRPVRPAGREATRLRFSTSRARRAHPRPQPVGSSAFDRPSGRARNRAFDPQDPLPADPVATSAPTVEGFGHDLDESPRRRRQVEEHDATVVPGANATQNRTGTTGSADVLGPQGGRPSGAHHRPDPRSERRAIRFSHRRETLFPAPSTWLFPIRESFHCDPRHAAAFVSRTSINAEARVPSGPPSFPLRRGTEQAAVGRGPRPVLLHGGRSPAGVAPDALPASAEAR